MSLHDIKTICARGNLAEGFEVIRRRLMALEMALNPDDNSTYILWQNDDAHGAIYELVEATREAIDATEKAWLAASEDPKPKRREARASDPDQLSELEQCAKSVLEQFLDPMFESRVRRILKLTSPAASPSANGHANGHATTEASPA